MKLSISIVCSMYRSANYLDEFYRLSLEAVKKITDNYEFIFVDDGSPDDSEKKIRKLAAQDSRVKLVVLSRNFGHFKATLAGLAEANGDLVYMTNCDLEESPDLLNRFYETLTTHISRPDTVGGYQIKRERGGLYRFAASLFYKILFFATDLNGPQDEIFSRLMTRNFVKELLRYSAEHHILMMGILHLTGFRQIFIGVEKKYKGSTAYSFWRKVSVMIDALTSFSSKPLVYISFMGLLFFVPAMAFAGYVLIRKIFFTDFQAGWASLIASIWVLGGLNILCVGVVGLYIGRIFAQVKNRPNYSIREIINPNSLPTRELIHEANKANYR